MQTPCLLGLWDVITSSLMGLFPTVNKALKQNLPLASFVKFWTGPFHCSGLGFSLVVSHSVVDLSKATQSCSGAWAWLSSMVVSVSHGALPGLLSYLLQLLPHGDPYLTSSFPPPRLLQMPQFSGQYLCPLSPPS